LADAEAAALPGRRRGQAVNVLNAALAHESFETFLHHHDVMVFLVWWFGIFTPTVTLSVRR
jgi:hypothetical protein